MRQWVGAASKKLGTAFFVLQIHVKPRPNDCNISTQHIATLLGATCCLRLATLLRRVATCWALLAQIWKWSNFSCNICGCCMMSRSFGQVRATMLRLDMDTSSIFNSQHVATRCNRVAKRVQHVAPNNVAICCVQMLRSFGRSLKTLGQKCWDMLRWSVAIVCPGL